MSEIYMYANGVGGRVFPPVDAEFGIAAAIAVGVLAAFGVILTVIAIVSKKRGEKEILSKLDDIWKEKASSKELRDLKASINYTDGIHSATADYLKGLSESSKAMADLAHLSLESVEDRLSPQNLESVVALEKSRARFTELQKTANVYTLISSSLPRFTDKVFDFGNPPEILALVMFPTGVEDEELFGYQIVNKERAMAARKLLLSVIYSVSLTEKHADRYTYEDLYKLFQSNNAKGIKEYFEGIFIPAAVSRQKGSGIVRYRAEYIISHADIVSSLKTLSSARNDVLTALRALRNGKDPSYILEAKRIVEAPGTLWMKNVIDRADRLYYGSLTKDDDVKNTVGFIDKEADDDDDVVIADDNEAGDVFV